MLRRAKNNPMVYFARQSTDNKPDTSVNTLLTNHLRKGIQFVVSFCVTVATNPYRAMSFS